MLSERVKLIPESKAGQSLKIAQENPNIISLGAGEPDFQAPKNVIERARELLNNGYTHYASFAGRKELREAIVQKLKEDNNIEVEPDDIVVTCGSTEAIMLSMLTLVGPGDEVIFTDPGYQAFGPMVTTADGFQKPIKVREEKNFVINPDELKQAITPKTKVIYLNTPANPTGAVLNKNILEELADIVVDKSLMIVSDEAYEKLVYGDSKHASVASLNGMKDYVITTQSFSKTFAMCGFRIGYAAGPKKVIEGITKFKLCSTMSAPTAFQLAAVEALKNSWDYVEEMKNEYDKRRKMVIKRLNEIPGIRCNNLEGAFYAFPNITGTGMNSSEFVNTILNKAQVLVLPGTEFGVNGEGYVRISYASAYEKLEEAFNRIENVLRNNK